MLQRTSPHWKSDHEGGRPRLLVEDAHGAFRNADFSAFLEAGFEVALCSGPDTDEECPLVRRGTCDLTEHADVILFGLGTTTERTRSILRALRERHPETPVVVELPRRRAEGAPLPDGCVALAFPVSVEGQLKVLWDAVAVARARRAADQRRAVREGEGA